MKKITLFTTLLLFTAFNYSAQALESRTVACTAGNLATLTADYKNIVTNLTVTGTIDARDFITMCEAMPSLTVLDLSGSRVAAFSGSVAYNLVINCPANEIPKYALAGNSSLTSFIYPSSIITIGEHAFDSCRRLTDISTIPSTVTTIGNFAYGYYTSLTGSVTIPSSVKAIGNQAFNHYNGIFIVDNANPYYSSFDGIIYNKNKTKLVTCPTSKTGTLTIPSSVITIGANAFDHCSRLTGSLTIPSSVTTIEAFAFNFCSGFTGSLTIPPSVTTIGEASFQDCKGFNGSLNIPSSVTSIGDYAFNYCSGLASIYSSAIKPTSISQSTCVFTNINKTTCTLHVPVNSKALYAATGQWMDFTNIVADINTSLFQTPINSITIFPNPATSSITVSELSSLVNDKTVTLSVTDVSGSTLFTQEVEPSIGKFTLDISSFKSGIYFIAIETSNGRVVKRFVKE